MESKGLCMYVFYLMAVNEKGGFDESQQLLLLLFLRRPLLLYPLLQSNEMLYPVDQFVSFCTPLLLSLMSLMRMQQEASLGQADEECDHA